MFDVNKVGTFLCTADLSCTCSDCRPCTLADWRRLIDLRKPVHMSVEDICWLILNPYKIWQIEFRSLINERCQPVSAAG